MAKLLVSNQMMRVRFPSPAPKQNPPILAGFIFVYNFYLTASFNPFPALNFGTFLAAILMVAPV